ncbi:hypothetical protein CHS0354_036074 [Potamilus streckersoni]|uniref:Palmitoyltransferase n=1 Tax=Potamilus streckersoni TaxID=2493646 RepID=A0AAE0TB49_9BIVA|nr:hypothetical protein CHS0354_036074 [Potamilus streckersoni]
MLCKNCQCGVNVCVRLTHTALCIAVPATLLWKNSGLKRAVVDGDDPLYGILYFLVLILSLVMYYTACLTDPGYILMTHAKKRNGIQAISNEQEDSCPSEDEVEDTSLNADCEEPLDKGSKYRYCDFCEIQQPMRSKHCEDCKRCVRKYDHHCPWLETCVGERNHKFFLMFLFVMSVVIIWTFCITLKALESRVQWSEWFKVNLLLFLDILVLIFGGFSVLGLCGFHSYLMLNGLTTWESVSREKITYLKYLDDNYNPFDEGYIRNVYYFLCFLNVRRWETIYFQKAKIKTSNGVV